MPITMNEDQKLEDPKNPKACILFAPTLEAAKALSPHDVIAPWLDHFIWLHHCALSDAPALQDWTDAALKDDYWFRRGHWLALLSRPQVQVYAAATGGDPESPLWSTAAIAIVYHNTRLLNLYVAKEFRGMSLGTELMRILSPVEIRAKTDMSAGDPTPFYERLGYTVQSTGEGPNGTISVMRRPATSTVPWLQGARPNGKK